MNEAGQGALVFLIILAVGAMIIILALNMSGNPVTGDMSGVITVDNVCSVVDFVNSAEGTNPCK